MLAIKLTGEVPFPKVFLHGLVRDEKGEKMSKTKGNVVDPLEVIERHGADALRFSLCKLTIGVNDLKLPEHEIIQSKYFINKIWNATKFVLFHLEKNQITKPISKPDDPKHDELDIFSKRIIHELRETIYAYNKNLDEYRFFEIAKLLYNFIWGKFCDEYIEISKPMLFDKLGEEKKQSALYTLRFVLEQSLKLLHPICPFVSEKLWQELPTTKGFLITQKFPKEEEKPLSITDRAERKAASTMINLAEQMINLIDKIRTVQGENLIKQKTYLFLNCHSLTSEKIEEYKEVILSLANLKGIEYVERIEKKEGFALSQNKDFSFLLDLASKDTAGEKKRLESQLAKISKRKEQLENKLNNPNFVAKAPAELVKTNETEVLDLKNQIRKTEQQLKEL